MAMAMADDDDDEHRHWLHARQIPPHHHEKFLLLSYNILADANARTHATDLLSHIPSLITDWNARKRQLLQELLIWAPDVICLQEVDRYHEFAEELEKAGYVGVYKRRTGAHRDGCAMFWRETRFSLLEEESVEFRVSKLRDNVAQICVLESKTLLGLGYKNRVVVGNIHVMFNPLRGEVKLGQARVFLEKLHAISGKWGNVPVAIAGDFNSTPWSPLYRFVSSSYLDLTGLDRRRISGQEDALETEGKSRRKVSNCERYGTVSDLMLSETRSSHEKTRISAPKKLQGWDQFELMAATGGKHLSVLEHKLKLRSAYSEIEGIRPGSRDARGEPFVTSIHKNFSGTVDYIWHTDDLCAVKVLDTLPSSVLQRNKGLPSQRWASDHMALACEFCFVPKNTSLLLRQVVCFVCYVEISRTVRPRWCAWNLRKALGKEWCTGFISWRSDAR